MRRGFQNGQFVSGNCVPVCSGVTDQTTYAGSRADLVQGLQKDQGRDLMSDLVST